MTHHFGNEENDSSRLVITHREENKRKIQKMLTICRRPISYSVCLRDAVKRFPNETTKVRVKEKREKLHLPRDSGPKMVSLISRKLLPFSKIEGNSRRSLTRHLHQSSYVKIIVTMFLWTI